MSEREKRLSEVLHRLWTKAVGTPGYDKREWQTLERGTLAREAVIDIDYAARVLGEAAGLKPTQIPGLALVLRMLAYEAWREGVAEAARAACGTDAAQLIDALLTRSRRRVFPRDDEGDHG